jgi:hypothetical protein
MLQFFARLQCETQFTIVQAPERMLLPVAVCFPRIRSYIFTSLSVVFLQVLLQKIYDSHACPCAAEAATPEPIIIFTVFQLVDL